MKNYQKSGNTMTVTATGAVASGDLVLAGSLFGIASCGGVAGDDIEVECGGQWSLPKATGQAWTQGQALYWDATAKNATTSSASGANTKIGVAAVAAIASATAASVRLNAAF